jgi:hypothetical protein
MELKCKVQTITPELAGRWLKHNQHNRSPRKNRISQYAADMADGRWQVTGDPIRFNCNGELIDGQNRLFACIQAKKSFRSVVIKGIDRAVRYVIDTGAKRTFGHFLQIVGEKSPNELAAALVLQWKYNNNCLGNGSPSAYPSYRQLHEALAAKPKYRQSVAFAVRLRATIPASLGAFLHYNGAVYDRAKVEKFLTLVKTGEKLSATHPAYQLREALIGRRTKGSRIQHNRNEQVAWGILALNAYFAGRSLATIKVAKSELVADKFPVFTLKAGK